MKTNFSNQSKHVALFAILFFLLSIPAFAQITISSSQFEQFFVQSGSSNNYNDTATAGLQSLVDQTGANQSWSFKGFPFLFDTTTSDNSTVVAWPGGAALADSFPTATHVQISSSGGTTTYFFYTINQSGFYALGVTQNVNGVMSLEGRYTPPLEEFALPLTYQSSWSSTSTITVQGYHETETVSGVVDGWGSFTLPGNITNQALRLKQKVATISPPVIIGKDTINTSSTTYSFIWVSPTAYSASISADSNQNATSAQYSLPGAPNIVLNNTASSQYSISAASNPVNSATNVSFTLPSESQVRVSLMDPLGRESQVLMNGMAHSGVNIIQLDPANLVGGTYFLRMESVGNTAMQKVVVLH